MDTLKCSVYSYPLLHRGFNDKKELAIPIIELVFNYYRQNLSLITSKSRKRELVLARQMSYYFIKKELNQHLTTIGKYFNQDHATVIHAIKTIESLKEYNRYVKEDYAKIEIMINYLFLDNGYSRNNGIQHDTVGTEFKKLRSLKYNS